jgi:hypothetical protein
MIVVIHRFGIKHSTNFPYYQSSENLMIIRVMLKIIAVIA